jgi:hypothetical protein
MFSFFRARIFPFLWLIVPSILWSISLQSPTLCVDAFVLPAIEERLPNMLSRLVRWAWVLIYSATLLGAWNIGPGTYLFYLHEALPFAPSSVLFALGFAAALMIWFGFQKDPFAGHKRLKTQLLIVGGALLLAKGLAASEVVNAPALRQYLRSATLVSIRKYILTPGKKTAAAVSETPNDTFYSLVKHEAFMPAKTVLMVVESWGEKRNALSMIAADIAGQGFQVLKYGFTSYRGSTLSGEFRELCSKYVQPSDGLIDEMTHMTCAPQYMHDKGYDVIGLHGYNKTFYARATMWSRFGVQTRLFGDDMQAQPRCPGPFPGVCDENLIENGINMLDGASKPTFLYMLTLSSHEPVDPVALERRGAYFNEVAIAHPTQIITRRAISSLITDLKGRHDHACTLIYVVGDHQPPSASAKGGIFETGKVPYLVFSQDCPAPAAG